MTFHPSSFSKATEFPALRGPMHRTQALSLIRRIRRRLGLSAEHIELLATMAECTDVNAWRDQYREPVCYRAQQDVAAQLGLTPRAVRNGEIALERAGLIARNTGADGHRSSIPMPDGRMLGISFTPLIENIAWLVDLDDMDKAENEARRSLRNACSRARRQLSVVLDVLFERDPASAELAAELRAESARWHPRYSSYRTNEALSEHLAAVEKVLSAATDALKLNHKTSAVEEDELPPIKDTMDDKRLSCSGDAANKLPARKRAEDQFNQSPSIDGQGYENECGEVKREGKGSTFGWLTARQIRSIASDDFGFYLDAFASGSLTERDIYRAAAMRVAEIGVSEAAWTALQVEVGPYPAALAILALDANRDHPKNPTRNPGGLVVHFTRLARAGKLNLSGTLMELARRKSR